MGTYGTATGLVLVVPAAGEPGKLLGLLNGELQAYFDSDGKIKWAGGNGILDALGIRIVMNASLVDDDDRVFRMIDADGVTAAIFGASCFGATGTGSLFVTVGTPIWGGTATYNDVRTIIRGNVPEGTGVRSGRIELRAGVYDETGGPHLILGNHVEVGGVYPGVLEINNVAYFKCGGALLQQVADATAATDALNRQTGDARYLVAGSESAAGNVELATVGEAATGTDTGRVTTPAGLPLRVVGSGWALKQTDGSAPGGNARGTAAVDLQTMRTADTQVASGIAAAIGGGSYNTASGGSATIGGGVGNTASGSYAAVGGGIYNTASGFGAVVPGGYYGVASKRGQLAHASGSFAVAGDAQRSVYVAHNITTDATPAVLYLDFDGDYLLTIADDTVWNFRAEIVAMTADAAKYAAYTVTGLIRRANGTVTVHGVTTTTITESDAGWNVTAEADDTNKALSIKVTGAAGTTIRWVAAIYTAEVSFPGA